SRNEQTARLLISVEPVARRSPPLNFEGEYRIHNGCPTIDMERLAGNKTCFLHTQQRDGVSDICRSAHASHRCPAVFMPRFNGLEDFGWQPAHDAVLRGSGADDVHCD